MSLLILIGFSMFSSIFSHGFALDDFRQIVHNPLIHHVQNIPSLFTQSILFMQRRTDITNYFYRPLFYSIYTLLYLIGKGNPLPFHVLQIMVYLANTVLVFLFFRKIFSKPTAFLLALLFLVHPDNEEVAAYIANLQDCLFFFFGMLTLIITQRNVQRSHLTSTSPYPLLKGEGVQGAWRGSILLFLLLSCLSKETGFLFVLILPVFVFLFQKRYLKQYFFISVIAATVYGLMRLYASRIFLTAITAAYAHGSNSFLERIPLVPKVISYEITDLLLPLPNLPVKEVMQTNAGVETVIVFVTLFVFFLCGIVVRKTKQTLFRYFIFFSIWFWIGIIFHSQIIPLDVPLAKRWMYFSLVGLIGICGILGTLYREKFPSARYFLVLLYSMYFLFFTIETSFMNQYWTKMGETMSQTYPNPPLSRRELRRTN